MNINFQYNKEKDIWCLMNKGKSSNNSQAATQVYQELVKAYGEPVTQPNAYAFIDTYIQSQKINIKDYREKYQKEWDDIADEYHKRAREIFGVMLPKDIIGYLTINNRCPYSIESNYFFVTVQVSSIRRIVMHELWHFYTWYGLGADQEEKLGKERYNDLKEALTVLLNLECKDLLPEGIEDKGYPQHKELREKMIDFWKKEKDIKNLWKNFSEVI